MQLCVLVCRCFVRERLRVRTIHLVMDRAPDFPPSIGSQDLGLPVLHTCSLLACSSGPAAKKLESTHTTCSFRSARPCWRCRAPLTRANSTLQQPCQNL